MSLGVFMVLLLIDNLLGQWEEKRKNKDKEWCSSICRLINKISLMQKLTKLYVDYKGEEPVNIEKLPGAGSNRQY